MKIYKSRIFEYRLVVNKEKAIKIDNTISCANFVRNLCIKNKEIPKASKCSKDLLDSYIEQYPDLRNVDFSALINSLIMLTHETNPKEKNESKSYNTTYSEFLRRNYPLSKESVFLPKIGRVKIRNSRNEDIGKIERFTVKKTNINHYYLYVHTIKEIEVIKKELNPDLSIGLDYSISHFVVDSNGIKYDKPDYFIESRNTIKKKQNALALKQKDSNNYKKIHSQIVSEYEKCKRRNMDYLHKKSTELADNYDYVMVEDLDLIKMSKTHNFAVKAADNAYATFVKMLEYKMDERGKKLIKVDRWFPSSKKCNVCGVINDELRLRDRTWTCKNCGTVHDRDINSAINIKKEGLRLAGLSAG